MAPISFNVDTRIHSESAIKKACYRFADRLDIQIRRISDNEIEIQFVRLRGSTDAEGDAAWLTAAVRREILDQDLREEIFKQTAEVRNLILAEAFKNTTLINS